MVFPAIAAAGPVQAPLSPGYSAVDPGIVLVARNKRPRTEGLTGVNFRNGGKFRKIGPKKWVEGNGKFTFREVGDDGRVVSLWDRSRNVYVYLDLKREWIQYAPDGEEPTDLYPITGILKDEGDSDDEDEFAEDPAKPKMASFICDEGIPMVMRFETRKGKAVAFVSLDGGAPMVLIQIPSGSGAKYANAEYTVWMKGRNAILEYDNNTDVCVGK